MPDILKRCWAGVRKSNEGKPEDEKANEYAVCQAKLGKHGNKKIKYDKNKKEPVLTAKGKKAESAKKETTAPDFGQRLSEKTGVSAAKNQRLRETNERLKRFNENERVRITLLDPQSLGYSAEAGSVGIVRKTYGYGGPSVYPDPLRKQVFVEWANGTKEPVYREHLEKYSGVVVEAALPEDEYGDRFTSGTKKKVRYVVEHDPTGENGESPSDEWHVYDTEGVDGHEFVDAGPDEKDIRALAAKLNAGGTLDEKKKAVGEDAPMAPATEDRYEVVPHKSDFTGKEGYIVYDKKHKHSVVKYVNEADAKRQAAELNRAHPTLDENVTSADVPHVQSVLGAKAPVIPKATTPKIEKPKVESKVSHRAFPRRVAVSPEMNAEEAKADLMESVLEEGPPPMRGHGATGSFDVSRFVNTPCEGLPARTPAIPKDTRMVNRGVPYTPNPSMTTAGEAGCPPAPRHCGKKYVHDTQSEGDMCKKVSVTDPLAKKK